MNSLEAGIMKRYGHDVVSIDSGRSDTYQYMILHFVGTKSQD